MKAKLFVWEDVLCDYTCGMVVVIATSLNEALQMVRDDIGQYAADEIGGKEPGIYALNNKTKLCFSVYGGG